MVLQDFTAGHSSELSIQVGQTVELLERPSERPGWCLVRTTDRSPPQEGLVPSSALCISHSRSSVEMDCFFPSGKGRQQSGRFNSYFGFRFLYRVSAKLLGLLLQSLWVKGCLVISEFCFQISVNRRCASLTPFPCINVRTCAPFAVWQSLLS